MDSIESIKTIFEQKWKDHLSDCYLKLPDEKKIDMNGFFRLEANTPTNRNLFLSAVTQKLFK